MFSGFEFHCTQRNAYIRRVYSQHAPRNKMRTRKTAAALLRGESIRVDDNRRLPSYYIALTQFSPDVGAVNAAAAVGFEAADVAPI